MSCNFLIGCERSQKVCIALRRRGFTAFSCDLEPCTGGHPEWHCRGDVLDVLARGGYDKAICFPPCTDLAVSGAKHFWYKREDGRQEKSIRFFLDVWRYSDCVENPVGIMNRPDYLKKWFPDLCQYALQIGFPFKPSQIINPWEFGHPESKKTCLWLKGFPLLTPTNVLEPERVRCTGCEMVLDYDAVPSHICLQGRFIPVWNNQMASGHNKLGPSPGRADKRAETYAGIAEAMADQWGYANG
jgi:hypothetical protein